MDHLESDDEQFGDALNELYYQPEASDNVDVMFNAYLNKAQFNFRI